MASPISSHAEASHAEASQSEMPSAQIRTLSRNNSNTSTASSGNNKGELSSTISAANSSLTSSRSQLAKLIDNQRQLLAGTCGTSTPIRSFQRATISSVVKTRAFDNNPVLKGLLASSAAAANAKSPTSRVNSATNSLTPSPHSTPIFSRSRSLRMSGGPRRYQNSPSHYGAAAVGGRSSRTPDLYNYSSTPAPSSNHHPHSVVYRGSPGSVVAGETNSLHESYARLNDLTNEKLELRESLEFLECERQVLMDSTRDLKDTLQSERSHWKRENEEFKKQLTELLAARVKAESRATRAEMEMNELRQQLKKTTDELQSKTHQLANATETADLLRKTNTDLISLNVELKQMLSQKLRYNGLIASSNEVADLQANDCQSIVTEMARLRVELNEKEKIISELNELKGLNIMRKSSPTPFSDMDNLNKFLDQTIECIKGWPDELASSNQVQNLMKTLLSSYKPTTSVENELVQNLENVHL